MRGCKIIEPEPAQSSKTKIKEQYAHIGRVSMRSKLKKSTWVKNGPTS